jgi:AMP deaminase
MIPLIVHCILTRSFAYERLAFLLQMYNTHTILNRELEGEAVKGTPRDFYSVAKVDTHVHLAAAFSEKRFSDFIKEKCKENPDAEVMPGKTLMQQMAEIGVTDPEEITIDKLNMSAGDALFDRFDNFNAKYSPFGNSNLRTIFMKTENYQNGKYFAELTKQLFHHFEKKNGNGVYNEYRVSIYGASPREWDDLASWMERWDVYSHTNMWMVQVPRIYRTYKQLNKISCFQDLLHNLWTPIFEATLHPDKHPALARFLKNLSGFDSVDDESLMEDALGRHAHISPDQWFRFSTLALAHVLFASTAPIHELLLFTGTPQTLRHMPTNYSTFMPIFVF